MFVSRRHSLFHCATWVAFFGLMLQVWLPVFHHPVQASPTQPSIHICSTAKTAQNDAGAGKAKPAACPICKMMHQIATGSVPPHAPVIARLTAEAEALVPRYEAEAPQKFFFSNARPRAPPILA